VTTSADTKQAQVEALQKGTAKSSTLRQLLTGQVAGPLAALILAVIIFGAVTDTFFRADNFALILQQSVVVGTLAIGQTLIILTAGIDLANGAIMVMGTVVIGQYALDGNPIVALVLGALVCVILGLANGSLVAVFSLPPFIVTLGVLAVVTAAARLFTESQSYPIESGLLTALNEGPEIGGTTITYGVMLWIVMTLVITYVLSQTSWGVKVYALGDNPNSARLAGVKVRRVLLFVYAIAGLIYAFGAWQALGRTPTADPSSYSTVNLDSITAVVIGGTSLFGGRGGVVGTMIGALIVSVLANGLTQAGIDSLYQQVATGLLIIIAVAVDHIVRRRQAR
jgi:fructose transport system permease protein